MKIKKLQIILTILIACIFLGCQKKVTIEELKKFVATETYPKDTFLDTVSNKRALIIVAHDDDDAAMSGTIAKLSSKGWIILQLSLQHHINPETAKNPAHIICKGSELILKDGFYRKGQDTMSNQYLPIPYSKIKEQFLTEKTAKAIIQKVNKFKPSVIFTLDNEKGGYGHPDHIFISQLIKDLFDEDSIKINKIYQFVYTDHMENEIMTKWLGKKMKKWGYPNVSDLANEMYGITGMPEPNVQIDISDVAEIKMKYLMTYNEDARKNLRKFIPYYEEFDAKTYFGKIFNKEYFRVIEKP